MAVCLYTRNSAIEKLDGTRRLAVLYMYVAKLPKGTYFRLHVHFSIILVEHSIKVQFLPRVLKISSSLYIPLAAIIELVSVYFG